MCYQQISVGQRGHWGDRRGWIRSKFFFIQREKKKRNQLARKWLVGQRCAEGWRPTFILGRISRRGSLARAKSWKIPADPTKGPSKVLAPAHGELRRWNWTSPTLWSSRSNYRKLDTHSVARCWRVCVCAHTPAENDGWERELPGGRRPLVSSPAATGNAILPRPSGRIHGRSRPISRNQ